MRQKERKMSLSHFLEKALELSKVTESFKALKEKIHFMEKILFEIEFESKSENFSLKST